MFRLDAKAFHQTLLLGNHRRASFSARFAQSSPRFREDCNEASLESAGDEVEIVGHRTQWRDFVGR